MTQYVVLGTDPSVPLRFTLANGARANCALAWSMTPIGPQAWFDAADANGNTNGILTVGGGQPSVDILVRLHTAALALGTYTAGLAFEGRCCRAFSGTPAICTQLGRVAAGSPVGVSINVTVAHAPATLTVNWTVNGEAPASRCASGAVVELEVNGVRRSAPCVSGTLTMGNIRPGTREPILRLLNASNAPVDAGVLVDAIDTTIRLVPGATRSLSLDLARIGHELDGATLRAANALVCPGAPNLVVNGDFEQLEETETGRRIFRWDGLATGVPSPPYAIDDGSVGSRPENSDFPGATAFSGVRFVAGPANQGYLAVAQTLAPALTPGNTYRVRAMLRGATPGPTATYDWPGDYEVQLRNPVTQHSVFVGRFLPVQGEAWQARSFTFQAPPEAATHSQLVFVPHGLYYYEGPFVGLDAVALTNVTACTRPSLLVEWTFGGRPANTCMGTRVRVTATGSPAVEVPCELGRAVLRDLVPGPTQVFVEQRPLIGPPPDRQELLADLRGADGVYARLDLAPLALDLDGSSCAATSLACPSSDTDLELLKNGGFESTPSSQEGVFSPPSDWEQQADATFPTGGGAVTASTDYGYDQTFGGTGELHFRVSSGADGARALLLSQGNSVAQKFRERLTPLQTYRIAVSLRAARLDSPRPEPLSVRLFLANADGSAYRFLGRLCHATDPLAWTRRSLTFVAPPGADTYDRIVLRAAGTVRDNRGVSTANGIIALDAASLKAVPAACAAESTGFRFTWDVAGVLPTPSNTACPASSIVRVTLTNNTLQSTSLSVPCREGRLVMGPQPAGQYEALVTLESAPTGGSVLATVDRPLTVTTGAMHAVHARLQRTTTSFSGVSCQPTTPVCAGKPNLLLNGSFEALPFTGGHLPSEWEEICGSGSCTTVLGTDGASPYNPEIEGIASRMPLVPPLDGDRFVGLRSTAIPIDPESTARRAGEAYDQKVAQFVSLPTGRRYRVRLWQHRATIDSNVSPRTMFELRFGDHTSIEINPQDGRFPRLVLATTCPNDGDGWEARSANFELPCELNAAAGLCAPKLGYLVLDPKGGDPENFVGLDAISLTDVTDCTPGM